MGPIPWDQRTAEQTSARGPRSGLCCSEAADQRLTATLQDGGRASQPEPSWKQMLWGMELQSSAFDDDRWIPRIHTGEGEDLSLPLPWRDAPTNHQT